MAISDEQYNNLINRVNYIEATINNIITAIAKLATLDQLRQLANLKQIDVDDLKNRMTAAENSIETLQGYHTT